MCSHNLSIASLEFSSLLSYAPRGNLWKHEFSRECMRALKNNQFLPDTQIPMLVRIAQLCAKQVNIFSGFFSKEAILVPVPSSCLAKPNTLWVPKILADALVKEELGGSVVQCLAREEPIIPKSSMRPANQRPTAYEQYKTMGVASMLTEPKEILLVDDVVTRGATFLGAANRLVEAYPRAHIRAFAAMRTISNESKLHNVMDPRKGNITQTTHGTRREP